MSARQRLNKGYGRVMRNFSEAEAREKVSKQISERQDHVMRLKEKYEKSEGLAFGNGKLDEMFEENPTKASNLLLFLEATERQAYSDPTLLENQRRVSTLNELKENRMLEAMQTGGAFSLLLPSDIVKISRIGYTNAVSHDIFDIWGMTSMKDSLYKLETLYGSTARGATAGDVTYESYNGGRYPTTYEQEDGFTPNGTNTTWTLTSATNVPMLPFNARIVIDGEIVATDDGAGKLVGSLLTGSANTVNYQTGAVTFTLGEAPANGANAEVILEYAYDFEAESLFDQTGSVLLNLVSYDFNAKLQPLAIEWTRFTEDLMNSKLGLSAKDMLIAGAGDVYKKAFDERNIAKGIQASNWMSAVNFDTDFATAGADSSVAHAQSVLNGIINAENATYDQLGRLADETNIVCDSKSYSYLTKHLRFQAVKPSSKVGIFKVGDIDGRGIYMAPKSVIKTEDNTGMLYIFGKSMQGGNVDAPVSVGTYGTGITTNPVELKNFNSQMGLGTYSDTRINNKYFATKVKLTNLTANS